MYTIAKDAELTDEIILGALTYISNQQSRLTKLKDYYLGQHDILTRQKNSGLSNNKLVINHASYITEINTGYLLGNPVKYQAGEGIDITEIQNVYKAQVISDLDVELARDCSIRGLTYERVYMDEESNPQSAQLNPEYTTIAYDNTVKHSKQFALTYLPVYTTKGDKIDHYDVTVLTPTSEITYMWDGKKALAKQGETPHIFGEVPVVEYRNNSDQKGDFEDVISLMDAYNLLQSDRVNEREQLVDALLVFKGINLDSSQREALKSGRTISGVPSDANIEYVTKSVNEADIDVLRKQVEADIYKISMTPNLSDENFVGNSSGVAIKYKLLAFEQKIKNKERFFERGLMERMGLYKTALTIGSRVQDFNISDVDAIFRRNLPNNDLETSQMINNLVGRVDDELLVGQLSFVGDAKETIEQAKAEKEQSETNAPEYGTTEQPTTEETPELEV